jgi:hypothetical protein
MKANAIIVISFCSLLVITSFISGCVADKTTPSLQGNTQYPGAMPAPSPNRSQANAAIDASTMIAPR